MENIASMYGNEIMETKSEIKNDVSISFSPKEKQQEIPDGAKILETRKSVNICEIENGYLVCVETYTYYEMSNDEGEKNNNSIWNTKKYYSKEKPIDIQLKY